MNTKIPINIFPPWKSISVPCGHLSFTEEGVVFQYLDSYLDGKNSVELAPSVPLKRDIFTHEGVFRDATPDYWGRNILDLLGCKTEQDYFLNCPADRIGAITTLSSSEDNYADLNVLAFHMSTFLGDTQDNVSLSRIISTGLGGSRPKLTIKKDNQLFVAKFQFLSEKWNNTRVEFATLKLAEQCGIKIAKTEIINISGQDILLVKRFDRHLEEDKILYRRMVSGLTILEADERRDQQWSYLNLADRLQRLGRPIDLKELFRRMTFNALVSNIDDHPRNHALIADQIWELSPAYDIVPTPLVSVSRRDLAMMVGKAGRYANRDNLISGANHFLLSKEEATLIVDNMAEQVKNTWYQVMRQYDVSDHDCETIRNAFVYEGFFYELPEQEQISKFAF